MPYPAAHNVLTMIGTVTSGTTSDVWQTGVRIGGTAGQAVGESATTTAMLDDIQADIEAWWTQCRGAFASNVRLERFKFNAVDVNGLYVSQTHTLQRDITTTLQAGSATGAALPAQLAVAVTLHTAASRGLAAKGRMYLPSPAITAVSGTGGRLSPTIRDAFQTQTATLLTNLGNWPGLDVAADPGAPVVASKVLAGAMRPITGVTVGDRFDVQRRRANRLTEVRQPITPVT